MTTRLAAVGFMNGKPTRDGQQTFVSFPMLAFKPFGLMVWGATALTRISAIKVGCSIQHIISRESCPARLFAAPVGFSFRDFVDLMKEKPTDGQYLEHWYYFNSLLTQNPNATPQNLVSLDTCSPGTSITIEYVGPMTDLALWGITE